MHVSMIWSLRLWLKGCYIAFTRPMLQSTIAASEIGSCVIWQLADTWAAKNIQCALRESHRVNLKLTAEILLTCMGPCLKQSCAFLTSLHRLFVVLYDIILVLCCHSIRSCTRDDILQMHSIIALFSVLPGCIHTGQRPAKCTSEGTWRCGNYIRQADTDGQGKEGSAEGFFSRRAHAEPL